MPLKAGETLQGEVYLGAEDKRKIRGYVTSSSRRLVPGMERISGTAICLPYGVDAVGLKPGETRQEWLTFTTNIGEYRLNFEIQVEEQEVRASTGQISTMEAFCDLAKRDPREAFRLYTDKSFLALLRNASQKEKALYIGLTAQPVTYQHMEEYLVALGLKEKVTISLSNKLQELFHVQENISQSFPISRSGWGHLRLEIEVIGDFLKVEKRVITEEDFIGKNYNLAYVVQKDRLSKGIRRGKIILHSPYETLEFEVRASESKHSGGSVRLREKRSWLALQKEFLEYTLGHLEVSEWASNSHYELNQLKTSGFADIEYQMYEAFLLYKEGKAEEAKQILVSIQNKSFSQSDLERAGIYLYLCTCTGLYQDRENALRRIRNFYTQKQDSMLLLYALLKLDPSYRDNPSKVLFELEELFLHGCKHPVLYAMAWDLVKEEENLFHRVSPFWIQVLLFAGRYGLLTEEMVMRFSYLAGYEKNFQESVYRALSYGGEAFPSPETTEAVCRYLMLGNPRKPEYFPWYERAVEQGVRLTRLYEYYVETVDTSYHKELPKPLLLYFTYNNHSLGDSRKAFLYASVISAKEKEPEIYEGYRDRILKFAEQKLGEGKIGEDYAVLYQEFLEDLKKRGNGKALAAQIFTNRLYCDVPQIRFVAVRHSQLVREEIYPLVQGIAYPRIYTEDAAVLFMDGNKRRYGVTMNYSCKPMMNGRELLAGMVGGETEDPGILLHFAENEEISKENLSLFQKLVQSDAFTHAYRRGVRKKILEFYASHVEEEELDEYLQTMDYTEYAKVDKEILLEVLIRRSFYQEAFAIVEKYGSEGLKDASLLKLVSQMILERDYEPEEELLALASEIYNRGIYGAEVLTYLMKYRYGSVEELLRIWKSAGGYELDTYAWEERILQVLMFTQDFRKEGEEVLEAYVRHHGKERIIGAYLTQISYGTFVKEYPLSEYSKKELEKAYKESWPVPQICHLALFKELVKEKNTTEESRELLETLLKECMKAGYTFSFMRKLPQELLAPYQLDDKVFVELHESPGAKVTLFYQLDQGFGSQEEYQSVPLNSMYEGIFVRSFTLFYGESLKYYFLVEHEGAERKTTERVLTMNTGEATSHSKYQQINRILSAQKSKSLEEQKASLSEYLRQQQYVDEFFTIVREP